MVIFSSSRSSCVDRIDYIITQEGTLSIKLSSSSLTLFHAILLTFRCKWCNFVGVGDTWNIIELIDLHLFLFPSFSCCVYSYIALWKWMADAKINVRSYSGTSLNSPLLDFAPLEVGRSEIVPNSEANGFLLRVTTCLSEFTPLHPHT